MFWILLGLLIAVDLILTTEFRSLAIAWLLAQDFGILGHAKCPDMDSLTEAFRSLEDSEGWITVAMAIAIHAGGRPAIIPKGPISTHYVEIKRHIKPAYIYRPSITHPLHLPPP